MKTIDLRNKSAKDLQAELVSLREEFFRLRFQHATAQLDNHRKIPAVKRDIARVLTILNERNRQAENA